MKKCFCCGKFMKLLVLDNHKDYTCKCGARDIIYAPPSGFDLILTSSGSVGWQVRTLVYPINISRIK